MSAIKIPPRAWAAYRSIANATGFNGWSANDNWNKQKWPGITPAQYYVLREAFRTMTGNTHPGYSSALSKALVERWLTGEHKELLCYAQPELVAKATAAFAKVGK